MIRVNIPNWKMTDFKKIIKSFNKKGINITYINHGETLVNIDGTDYICSDIEIEDNYVYAVKGWEFIGIINFLDSGNTIIKVNDVDVPDYYKTCKCECEHCHTVRNRNETYLVRNTSDGTFKQVGRKCLKDYTGLNPAYCVNSLSLEKYIESLTDCSKDTSRMMSSYEGLDTNRIIEIAYNEIVNNGFKPTSEGSNSTKDKVLGKYYSSEVDQQMSVESRDKLDYWVNNLKVENDFDYNSKVIYNSKICTPRELGYICAFINKYFKFISMESSREARNAKSRELGYLGAVGNNVQFTVAEARVLYSRQFCYSAPVNHTYRIIDLEGNIIIWTTNKPVLEGKSYLGTVKAQQDYNGTLQTIVTRCKLLK